MLLKEHLKKFKLQRTDKIRVIIPEDPFECCDDRVETFDAYNPDGLEDYINREVDEVFVDFGLSDEFILTFELQEE